MMTTIDAIAIAIIGTALLALILRLDWIGRYPDECRQRRQDTALAQEYFHLALIELAYLRCILKAIKQEKQPGTKIEVRRAA